MIVQRNENVKMLVPNSLSNYVYHPKTINLLLVSKKLLLSNQSDFIQEFKLSSCQPITFCFKRISE